jgi:NADP-dependent aldehyde dehydrogenase
MGNMQALTGAHLIAGEWVRSEGEGIRTTNPATGKALEPPFCQAGQNEVARAFQAATAAFQQTRDLPASRWAELLEAIADQILALDEPLIATAQAETALPPARLLSERGRTCGQLRLFAELVREGSWVDTAIDTADPARQPLPKPDVRRMLRPLGPVVVFDASNFPFAFGPCGGDTASALAAGNPVIVKVHPGHPATDELFARAVLAALQQVGLPVGLFALLQGAGTDLGALLVQHPAAEAVGFTGSQRAGRALFDLAAKRPRPIPVYAEMGSLNPLVVLPAALAERGEQIATGLAQSVTLGGGQFCTKPGLVLFIGSPDADNFTAKLAEQLGALLPFTLLNSAIQQGFRHVTEQFRTVPGLTVHVEGACSGSAQCSPSLFEVDAATWRQRPRLHEEAFGPAALLVRCADAHDLIATLQAMQGHLTGTLHTGHAEAPELVRQVASTLEQNVGRLIFNGYPTGVEVCHAMVHGGPYPATTAAGFTSVGTLAIQRFVRLVSYQNVPDALLPPALQNANPLGILRLVNGEYTRTANAI